MNERIKELAVQSGFYVSANGAEILIPDPHTEDITVVMKKFAELIVRECMNVGNALAKETFSYSTQPGDIFEYKAHAMEDVVEAINEHFGVKE